MTLSTNLYVLDKVDVPELFRFCQTLLTKYDDRPVPQKPEEQRWSDNKDAYTIDGAKRISNQLGQGLPAILDITYRPDGPLTSPGQAEQCTSDCEPSDADDPDGYHSHPHACWADIDFDTTYGYRDRAGRGCGDLHALLVAEVGNWLDERGVRWEWRNEFSGEVHGGDERYARLVDLARGGFDAMAWMRTTVLPAIAAGLIVDHGPVKPPYGTPEREAYDREHSTGGAS